MKIHWIGDSHVNLFSGYNKIQPCWPIKHKDKWEFFKTYRLGSHLAYSLSKPKSKNLCVLKEALATVNKNDIVFLSYGEIDCRVHLIKQSLIQGRKLHLIVNECVDNYIKVLAKIRKMGYRIGIVEPVASSNIQINYEEFVTFGSAIERNVVTSLFNSRLRFKAKLFNIPVLSINHLLLDKHMNTNMKYYCDPIHLSTNCVKDYISQISKIIPDLERNKNLMKIASQSRTHIYIFNKFIRINVYVLKNFFRKILFGNNNIFNIDDKRERLLTGSYKDVYLKYINNL